MTEPLLTTTPHAVGNALVVRVEGAVDLATAPNRSAALSAAGDAATVVADLTGVRFMASAGLSALVEMDERCRAGGIGFAVVLAPTAAARRALEITGLVGVLTVTETVDQALAALS